MLIDDQVLALSQIIWDYHLVNHSLEPADCIMVLGSHDLRVAERGAELWLKGYAPYIVFSGGLGRLTEGLWTQAEADKFAQVAITRGVPADKILIENKSTNTGENIRLSYRLLQQHAIPVKQLILVQKPYMERRTLATFEKQWPGPPVTFQVTSPLLSFSEYPNAEISQQAVINIMLGDLQRIKIYPELGYQSYQFIPDNVWQAFLQLKEKGFTSHLLPE